MKSGKELRPTASRSPYLQIFLPLSQLEFVLVRLQVFPDEMETPEYDLHLDTARKQESVLEMPFDREIDLRVAQVAVAFWAGRGPPRSMVV